MGGFDFDKFALDFNDPFGRPSEAKTTGPDKPKVPTTPKAFSNFSGLMPKITPVSDASIRAGGLIADIDALLAELPDQTRLHPDEP